MSKYFILLAATFVILLGDVRAGLTQPAAPEAPLCELEHDEDLLTWQMPAAASPRPYRDGDSLELSVASRERQTVILNIKAWLGSEPRQGYLGQVASLKVPVGASPSLRIPLESLQLPTEKLSYSGQIFLMGEVVDADGAPKPLHRSTQLYFHRDGDAWWIYDAAARDGRFNHGILDPESGRLLEVTREPRMDHVFIPTNVHKIPGDDNRPDHSRLPFPDVGLYEPGSQPEANPQFAGPNKIQAWFKPGKVVDVCYKTTTYFTDANSKQDYWIADVPYDRAVPGVKIKLQLGQGEKENTQWTTRGTFYLNSHGCTGPVDLHSFPDRMMVSYYSETQWNGNKLLFQTPEGNAIKVSSVVDFKGNIDQWSAPIPPVQKINLVNGTLDPLFNVQASMSVGVAAMPLKKGLLADGDLPIVVTVGTDGYSVGYSDRIEIGKNALYEKFVHTHELAHVVHQRSVGPSNFNAYQTGYKVDDPQCDDAGFDGFPNGNGHSMTSKEYAGSALIEAFAQFYGAAVFNDEGEDDCSFYYYKDDDPKTKVINCGKAGEGIYDLRYMENHCTQTTMAYRGTELDWFRLLWNLYTDKSSGSSPSFSQVLDWMNIDFPFKEKETDPGDAPSLVQALDIRAKEIGGALKKNWEQGKTEFGVYH